MVWVGFSRRSAILIAASLASSGSALATTVVQSTWIGPATGSWIVNSNWSGGIAPLNSSGIGYVATVDANPAQATTASIGGISFGLHGLNVGSNDQVRIENGSSIGIIDFDNGSTTLTINNAGTITLAGTAAFTELFVQNPLMLTGGGTVVMGGPIGNRITNPNQPGIPRFTNVNNTIIGSGTIASGGFPMRLTNQGTISASAATLTFIIGTTGNFNTGFISAVNAGTLLMRNTNLDNTGGAIAGIGGTVYLDAVNLTGGNITTGIGSGLVRVGNVGGGTTTTNLSSMGNAGTLELLGNTTINFTGFGNSGSMHARPASRSVVTGTLSNSGNIILEQGPNVGGGGASIILNGNVTLAGAGTVVTNLSSGALLATFQRTNLGDTLTNFNTVLGRMWVETNIDNFGTFDCGGPGQGMLLGSSITTQPTTTLNRPGGVIRSSGGQLVFAMNSTVTNQGTITCLSGGSLVVNTGATATGNGFNNDGWTINLGVMSVSHVTGNGSFDHRGGTTASNVGLLRQDRLILQSGTLQIAVDGTASRTVRVRQMNINGPVTSPAATLDLTNNLMVVDYTTPSPLASIGSWLASGYNSGAWTGAGIRSSSAAISPLADAIGFAESSAIFLSFPAVFGGQSVDNTAVLLRLTLYGDANLDGTVNIADFSRLAANFNQPGTWSSGDFNYDQQAGIADFSLLAANFNQTIPPPNPGPLPGSAPVPEPTGATALLALCLLNRRPRRARR